ncbi:MAG: transporter [Pseudomonadota bacterium]
MARLLMAVLATLVSYQALADGMAVGSDGMMVMRPDSHAPFGVMGDHMHKKGEWMLSYRYMFMDMEGNRIDDNNVSPQTIATTVPNRFFGRPGQPSTLRVVPTEMTMEMHMFGGMYAPSDFVTLMVMGMHVEKEMDHLTFMGGMGTNVLGGFTTESSGIGDTSVVGLFRTLDTPNHKVNVKFGGSIPTGSTEERDTILTPMGATPTPRMPYAMQLGSGTFDLLPGATYSGHRHDFGWGAQYAGTIRTGDDNGYSWGDKHELTGWASYQPLSNVSVSVRLAYQTMGNIDGMDPMIVAPVQTADPDNYGGERLDLLFGINIGSIPKLNGLRFAFEGGIPVMQDLNGPQMETDFVLTAGAQFAF